MARDFDLGMMGPPLDISMAFIAGGLVIHRARLSGLLGIVSPAIVGRSTMFVRFGPIAFDGRTTSVADHHGDLRP